jgi:predicted acylesterase/phospholipase RssA/CRP-like cAMP-binding protein
VQQAILERFAAIAEVSVETLDDVTSHAVAESVPRGGFVFRRGDAANGMYLLLEGQVALEIGGTAVGLCGPGQWFGELAVFTAGPRTADARAVMDTTLVRIDRAGWAELAARSPRLLASLCERLSRQLRAAAEEQRRSRTVVACLEADGLVASVRRQFPLRDLRVVAAGGATLERELAELTAPDMLVIATAPRAAELADRVVSRVDLRAWSVTPGYGGRSIDLVRGRTPEEAVDRVARRLAGRTVGLALGAGGAYGFAHIGLVQALEEAGVPVDYVAGTSMGAIMGACVAAGVGGDRMRTFAESVAARYRRIAVRDIDWRGRSLLTGRAVMSVLAELDELRTSTFETLDVPFVAIATDIDTGVEVPIASGPLLDGIRPSFTMPSIFPPCVRDGRPLIDGAMVNPVPVDRVRALGADFVVALQPIPPLAPLPRDPSGVFGRTRWITQWLPVGLRGTIESLEVSVRSFQALWRQLAIEAAASADLLVTPDLEGFFFLQFGAAGEIIAAGRRAADEALAANGTVLRRDR